VREGRDGSDSHFFVAAPDWDCSIVCRPAARENRGLGRMVSRGAGRFLEGPEVVTVRRVLKVLNVLVTRRGG
jgi:hypothetical protein